MPRHQTLIQSPDRPVAVIAHWEDLPHGLRLRRLTAQHGPLPEYEHLIDPRVYFPDLDALKRAVLATMHGPVGDTLDNVLLTERAYNQWMNHAQQALANLKTPLDPQAIPDERARALPNGCLRIWVDLPNGHTVKLDLPPEDWAWRNGPPH